MIVAGALVGAIVGVGEGGWLFAEYFFHEQLGPIIYTVRGASLGASLSGGVVLINVLSKKAMLQEQKPCPKTLLLGALFCGLLASVFLAVIPIHPPTWNMDTAEPHTVYVWFSASYTLRFLQLIPGMVCGCVAMMFYASRRYWNKSTPSSFTIVAKLYLHAVMAGWVMGIAISAPFPLTSLLHTGAGPSEVSYFFRGLATFSFSAVESWPLLVLMHIINVIPFCVLWLAAMQITDPGWSPERFAKIAKQRGA